MCDLCLERTFDIGFVVSFRATLSPSLIWHDFENCESRNWQWRPIFFCGNTTACTSNENFKFDFAVHFPVHFRIHVFFYRDFMPRVNTDSATELRRGLNVKQ